MPATFDCPTCLRSFRRAEHLRRHELSHDSSSRLPCSICKSTFSRRDALQRHEALHASLPSLASSPTSPPLDSSGSIGGALAGSMPTSTRSRSAITKTRRACTACSRQKTKCDGAQPCRGCRSRPGAHCVYPTSRMSSSVSVEPLHGQGSSLGPNRRDLPSPRLASLAALASDSITGAPSAAISGAHAARKSTPPQASAHGDVSLPMSAPDINGHRTDLFEDQVAIADGFDPQDWLDMALSDSFAGATEDAFSWIFAAPAQHPIGGQHQQPTQPFPQPLAATMSTPAPIRTMPVHQSAAPIAAGFAEACAQSSVDGCTNGDDATQGLRFMSMDEQAVTVAETPVTGDDVATPGTTSSRREARRYMLGKSGILDTAGHDHGEDDEDGHGEAREASRSLHASHAKSDGARPQRGAPPRRSHGIQPDGWWRHPAAPSLMGSTSTLPQAPAGTVLAEDTMQVAPVSEYAKQKLLSIVDLAELDPDDSKRAHNMLAGVDVAAYNAFVQLYFEHFHPLYPFIHQATFSADRCSVFLIASVTAIGCMYSRIPQAPRVGDLLVELTNKAQFVAWHRTGLQERSISFIQAMTLNFIFQGSSGERAKLEFAEAMRSPLATMARRRRLLDGSPPGHSRRSSSSTDPYAQWQAWIHRESIVRTGWVCFVADMELSLSWNLPPTFYLDELKADLPCNEALWNAPNESMWTSVFGMASSRGSPARDSYNVAQLHEALRRGIGTRVLEEEMKATQFQKVVLAKSLCTLSDAVSTICKGCPMPSALRLSEEFEGMCVTLAEQQASLLQHQASKLNRSHHHSARLEMSVRFDLLRNLVDLQELQTLGGRNVPLEKGATLDRILARFDSQTSLPWRLAVHAGRIVFLFRSYPTASTFEGLLFFYAAVALHLTSLWLQRSPPPPDVVATARALHLDGPHPISLSAERGGNRLQLSFIGDLSSPEAPRRILTSYAEQLRQRAASSPWPICEPLAAILTENVGDEC